MKFDVQEFLFDHNIEFREKGKNVMKEHVAVSCPWCSDPSQHYNVKLDGTHALCFHCGEHQHKAVDIAKAILKEDLRFPELLSLLSKYKYYGEEKPTEEPVQESVKELRFSEAWDSFVRLTAAPDQYIEYLHGRGIDWMYCSAFGVKIDLKDQRIVFPVHNKVGKAVNYVGRTIVPSVSLRYKNCPSSVAIQPAGECLFGLYHSLTMKGTKVGRTVVVVEGIIDCMKLLRNRVKAIALMKKVITAQQAELLFDSFPSDTAMIIALDSDTSEQDRKKVFEILSVHFIRVGFLFTAKKDIGECSNYELIKLKHKLARAYK